MSAFDGQLPNGWDDCGHCREPQRLDANGLCPKCADDLQIWIRHGRIGRGTSYQQEVERAKQIEADHGLRLRDVSNDEVRSALPPSDQPSPTVQRGTEA
jgi:hypothetical protein